MARKYKLEIQRSGTNAVLYYHDDGTLEIIDADSDMIIDYLQDKLTICQKLFDWMNRFGVESFECSTV